MAVICSDDFNRADSAITLGSTSVGGFAWTSSVAFGISSNQAYCPGGNNDGVSTVDSLLSDVDVSITMANYGSNPQEVAIYFRYTDANNWWRMVRSSGTILIQKFVAAVRTNVFSAAQSFSAGDVFKVSCNSSNIKIFINNSLIATAVDSFNQTATKHGFGLATGASDPRWDNFLIAVPDAAVHSLYLNSLK